jgi:hypothetical protein
MMKEIPDPTKLKMAQRRVRRMAKLALYDRVGEKDGFKRLKKFSVIHGVSPLIMAMACQSVQMEFSK